MLRPTTRFCVFVALFVSAGPVWSQTAAPPRVGSQQSLGNSGLRRNTFQANKPVAMTNSIVQPLPLTSDSQRNALTNIDRHVASQVAELAEKLKTVLPDELSILTKTSGWKSEDRQALVDALRAGDPTTVYDTWVKGNPQDTAGAELTARQTDLKRIMTRLTQDAEKNKGALKQDVTDFDATLTKIAGSTPGTAEISGLVKTLKTWVEARKLIDAANPGKGSVARLPGGSDVTLILDPALRTGTAIVLNEQAMLIGHEGHTALAINTGNPAEALGLPIVTGAPVADTEGGDVAEGVLIVNPATSQGTINYNLNGNHFVAQPGMQQKLSSVSNRPWILEFDRGERFGPATYTLSPGSYYFKPTDLGWQLYRHRFDVVLDNSQSNQEFHFIFRGTDMTVAAGGTKTLSSNYPIVVKFDRGNGSKFVAKTVPLAVGTLQVGVNADDNLWDLFPTSGNRREPSNLKPFNTEAQPKR